jgi:hypothetical protein
VLVSGVLLIGSPNMFTSGGAYNKQGWWWEMTEDKPSTDIRLWQILLVTKGLLKLDMSLGQAFSSNWPSQFHYEIQLSVCWLILVPANVIMLRSEENWERSNTLGQHSKSIKYLILII